MRSALPVILLLVLVPSGTLSKVPADHAIQPGRRIGPWALGMTVDQFVRAAGQANAREYPEMLDLQGRFDFHCTTDICGFYRGPGQLILLRVSLIGKFSRTERGPGVGSTARDVLSIYGRPTITSRIGDDFGGYARLIYDAIGVAFRVNLITDTVVSISIFRPGTAASIWRY